MEQAGLIALPAKQIQKKTRQKPIAWTDKTQEQAPVTGPLDDIMPIRVLPVGYFGDRDRFAHRVHAGG